MQQDLLKRALRLRARTFRVLHALAVKAGCNPNVAINIDEIVTYLTKRRGDEKYGAAFVKRELNVLADPAHGYVTRNGENGENGFFLSEAAANPAVPLIKFVKASDHPDLAGHRCWIDPENRALRPARVPLHMQEQRIAA